ncbi:aspartic proteinase nepenthesin-1-like [Phragmites australis]|uniref:aspartic proteinase nepenthesin-1-like n=1 Tax=Phragmites australis TaxID=29695 RepID=UPI002D76DF6A|nr:aspartic proteinase nepenthesin-1-like [Phragmites australis]
MARHLHLLRLLCLAVVVTAARAMFHFNFGNDLGHPFGGSSYTRHEIWRRAALASKARVARQTARLGKVLGKSGDISAADVTISPYADQGHWLTVGIGTPPQPSKLIIDIGSGLTWTQCKLLSPMARQLEPLYDPGKSSSFSLLPCSSKQCQEAVFTNKSCTNNKCLYENDYGSNVKASGVLASETFTFGVHRNVSLSALAFGCGKLSSGSIAGASGIMGLSPSPLSLITQLSIPRFSYCFTPFAERKTSPLMFGAKADLSKYKTAGPIQTISILRNPVEDIYYYVPLVGLSLGTKRLDVPAASLALKPDGTGGTVVDSGTTMANLVEPAFKELKKAVLETVKLPVANRTVEEYQLCFALPRGVSMDKVQTPPLRLHFDGGAEMVLPRDNFFQEPSPELMCLAVVQTPDSFAPSVIGNVQQQNMHVLYDVGNRKFSFAPTQCDQL